MAFRGTRAFLLLIAALTAACSNPDGTPSSAAPSPAPAAPDTVSVTGRVTAINDGAPLSGLQVASGGTAVTTGADGAFALQLSPLGLRRIDITGETILARTVWSSGTTASANAIRLGPDTPFDLNYYRQLLRDALANPAALQALRRWTIPINLYVRTVDEANQPVPQAQVDFAARIIAETVPIWSDGRISVASVEQGPNTRLGILGWITVTWPNPREDGVCGRATIGGNRGFISLNYLSAGCNCGAAMRPSTIRHEVGHSMGFWHTDRADDLMFASSGQCDRMPTARERLVAAIAYQRPVGNADPDADPPTPLAATGSTVAIP